MKPPYPILKEEMSKRPKAKGMKTPRVSSTTVVTVTGVNKVFSYPWGKIMTAKIIKSGVVLDSTLGKN